MTTNNQRPPGEQGLRASALALAVYSGEPIYSAWCDITSTPLQESEPCRNSRHQKEHWFQSKYLLSLEC